MRAAHNNDDQDQWLSFDFQVEGAETHKYFLLRILHIVLFAFEVWNKHTQTNLSLFFLYKFSEFFLSIDVFSSIHRISKVSLYEKRQKIGWLASLFLLRSR